MTQEIVETWNTCFALLADDIRWTNIGSTRFSGTYTGKDKLIYQLLGLLFGQLKAGISSSVEKLIAEEVLSKRSEGPPQC